MADPNQTPKRGDWACPCSGCQKAMAFERKQIIYLLENISHHEYNSEPYDMIIEMIQARMPKAKKK
jgi:hypothetical protein